MALIFLECRNSLDFDQGTLADQSAHDHPGCRQPRRSLEKFASQRGSPFVVRKRKDIVRRLDNVADTTDASQNQRELLKDAAGLRDDIAWTDQLP